MEAARFARLAPSTAASVTNQGVSSPLVIVCDHASTSFNAADQRRRADLLAGVFAGLQPELPDLPAAVPARFVEPKP